MISKCTLLHVLTLKFTQAVKIERKTFMGTNLKVFLFNDRVNVHYPSSNTTQQLFRQSWKSTASSGIRQWKSWENQCQFSLPVFLSHFESTLLKIPKIETVLGSRNYHEYKSYDLINWQIQVTAPLIVTQISAEELEFLIARGEDNKIRFLR